MSDEFTNYRVRLGPVASSLIEGDKENRPQRLDDAISGLQGKIKELEDQAAKAPTIAPENAAPGHGNREDYVRLEEAFQKQEQQLWAMKETLVSQLKMTRICVAALMEKRGGEDMDELVDMASELHHDTILRTNLMTENERAEHDIHERDLMEQARQIVERPALEKTNGRDEEMER